MYGGVGGDEENGKGTEAMDMSGAGHKIKYRELIRRREGEVYGFFFYVPMFFMLSFGGWLWEVLIYLVKDGEFVNRGVLFGPWLPVYGCGGVLLIFLLGRWVDKPVRVFFLSLVLGTVLEYFTSFFLEWVWGVRWWDYSGEFLNVNGRVCLWGSLLFGAGGWLLICYVNPYVKLLYRKIWRMEMGRKVLQLVCLILLIFFTADAAWAADFPNMGRNISM